MIRLYLPALALLLITGAARAEGRDCYVLWEAQCFEIHDAQSRDITHHVVMTDGPIQLRVQADRCEAEAPVLRDKPRQALLAAFNERMADIDGCEPLDKLKSRASKQAEPLVERFQRLREPHERRVVHLLDPPEAGS